MDFSLLRELTETPGISGREEKVRSRIASELARMDGKALETSVDGMGNLIAHIPGSGLRVALLAHMDEIGFMVSKIEDRGFLRVVPVGGVDPKVFWAQKVIVHGERDLAAVAGSVPPHLSGSGDKETEKAVPIEESFIDPGLPAEEVRKLVRIGDPVTFAAESWENETAFFAKALDDRVGLFVLLESIRRVARADCDLFLVATAQEEYGLRGAGPAMHAVKPDVVLALEGTVASDTPGLKLPANLTPTALGRGPEIRLTDRQMISDRILADFLDRLAGETGIPRQVIVKKIGSTDAAAAQIAGPGTRACGVSVPVRYIHAPAGLVYKSDIIHTIALVSAFLEKASGLLSPTSRSSVSTGKGLRRTS